MAEIVNIAKQIYQKQWYASHKKKCLDCDKLVKFNSLRCKACETTNRWNSGFNPSHPVNSGQFIKGQHPSLKTEFKPQDKIGYAGIHFRIKKMLGMLKKCEFCGTTTASMYDWANKNHTYKLNPKDWLRLCRKCHIHFDKGLIYG